MWMCGTSLEKIPEYLAHEIEFVQWKIIKPGEEGHDER